MNMKVVWTEDDATPGTEGHVTLSAAWKKRYNESWCDARKDAINEEDCGDCIVFTMPDGRVAYESYPGANEIHGPDNYVPVYKTEPGRRLEEEYNWNERTREPF
jgi:hypothetical protein